MADNVTYLPRPRAVRPAPDPVGLYVRAGRNDHKALLNLLSAGDLRCFGVVIDAVHVGRHRELREQASSTGWTLSWMRRLRRPRPSVGIPKPLESCPGRWIGPIELATLRDPPAESA